MISKTKLLTLKEVQTKYKDIYICVNRVLDYDSGGLRFIVTNRSRTIKENMSLGQDIGTEIAYTR